MSYKLFTNSSSQQLSSPCYTINMISNVSHVFVEATFCSNEILGPVKIIIRRSLSYQDSLDSTEEASRICWTLREQFLNHCHRLCTEVDIMNPVPGNACIRQFSHTLSPTLCNHMDGSRPGFPVHHQLPELTQTHSIESVMP